MQANKQASNNWGYFSTHSTGFIQLPSSSHEQFNRWNTSRQKCYLPSLSAAPGHKSNTTIFLDLSIFLHVSYGRIEAIGSPHFLQANKFCRHWILPNCRHSSRKTLASFIRQTRIPPKLDAPPLPLSTGRKQIKFILFCWIATDRENNLNGTYICMYVRRCSYFYQLFSRIISYCFLEPVI